MRARSFIYRATKRLEGHEMALGLLGTVVGLFMAYIAYASINGVPFQDRYELKAVVSADSPILQKGDTVRIAGRLAGLIRDVEPGDEPGSTEISMDLRPQYAPVGNDATATVRVKSIIYLTYLEIDPGTVSDPMQEGGTIPLERTRSNVDLLEVVDLFDRKSRETLSKAIFNTGVGLADRGRELNASLSDVRTVAEEGTSQLEALTREPGAIARGIRGASRTASGLTGNRPDDVAGVIGSGSAVVGTIADNREELGETIEILRPFEEEFLRTAPLMDPVLTEAADLAGTLDPVLADLAAALRALNGVLSRGEEIRLETKRLTGFLRPVLRETAPIIAALQPTVASIDLLIAPLAVLEGTLQPFARDLTLASRQLISVTRKDYSEGTSPGASQDYDNPALRFTPVFGDHSCRNPYPEPGEGVDQREPC